MFLRLFTALTLLATTASSQSPTDGEPARPELFSRVAVLGASVSAGYGLRTELDAHADLGTVVECALRAEPGSVSVFADQFFFTNPDSFGRRFLAKVAEWKPTLVIALDYLFWFPFGPEPSEEARLAELEEGLALLAELDCELLLADFPDVSQALEGVGPFGFPLVTRELLAAPETLVKLNARLDEWARARGRVTIAPMGVFLARLRASEALGLRQNEWPAEALEEMLQPDLLHPTAEGTIALTLLALDALAAAHEGALEPTIDWDAKHVRERLMQRTEAERAEERQKRLEREARRKARDDGDRDGDAHEAQRARQSAGSLAPSV